MKRFLYKIKERFVRSNGISINYETLLKMKKNTRNVWVIDVRAQDEYYTKHIDGAINIPLQDINDKIENIVKNKNDVVIMYCEYGGRSKKACTKLEKLGYINVYNLENGIAGI